jgi:hypothetical protein
MLESQGSRPLDPYRALQLHPGASRELVAEAYWHLVSRRKQRGETQSVSDLSAAYGLLMNDARRAAYDDEHGLNTARGHGRELDYYELLGIDRDADLEMVSLAHSVLTRSHARHDNAALRDAIDEAFRTLRNPQLRAQYEAWLGSSTAATSTTPAVPIPTVVSTPVHEMVASVPAIRESAPVEPPTRAAESTRVTDAPAIVAIARAPAATRRETSERPSGLLRRIGIGGPGRPKLRATHGPPRRFDSDQAVDTAKADRLLALQPEPWAEAAEPSYESPGPGAADGLARLTFIAGPFAGLRVGLSGDVVTVGSDPESDLVLADPVGRVAPEHARIWKQGEHFAFRQCEGARTVIGGLRLVTAVVMLDDGDEIQIGPHRMTFSLLETSASQA